MQRRYCRNVYHNDCFDLSYALESGFAFQEDESDSISPDADQADEESLYTTDMLATNDEAGESISVTITDISDFDPREVPSDDRLLAITVGGTKNSLEKLKTKNIQTTDEEIRIAEHECPATLISYTVSGSTLYMECSVMKAADGIAIITATSPKRERIKQMLTRFTTIDQADQSSAEADKNADTTEDDDEMIDVSEFEAFDGRVDYKGLVKRIEDTAQPFDPKTDLGSFPNPYEGEWGVWKDGIYESEKLGIRIKPQGAVQPAIFIKEDMTGEPDFQYGTDLAHLGLVLMNLRDSPNLDPAPKEASNSCPLEAR